MTACTRILVQLLLPLPNNFFPIGGIVTNNPGCNTINNATSSNIPISIYYREIVAKLLSSPSFPNPHCKIRFPFVSETAFEYILKSKILP